MIQFFLISSIFFAAKKFTIILCEVHEKNKNRRNFQQQQRKIPKIEGDRQEAQATYVPKFQINQSRTGKALFTKNMKTSS